MTDAKENHILGLGPGGFHKVAYREWGDPNNPDVLVCVHGLTRNSHDFDYLARKLQHKYRVICPDVVGRGNSDFTKNPATYNITQYVYDMAALIARIGVDKVSWLGTSMGGIIGMSMASKPNNPIRRLILNDVGMMVPKESIAYIKSYATKYPEFENLDEARKNMEQRLSTFGVKEEEHILHLLKHTFQKGDNEKYHYAYDFSLMEAMEQSETHDTRMENLWQAVQCPVLILRGELSMLLLEKTAQEMVAMKPGTDLVEIPDVGHAPALMEDSQIQIIEDWLALN